MKLYIYDHCPFCVRARMIFGLRDVAVDEAHDQIILGLEQLSQVFDDRDSRNILAKTTDSIVSKNYYHALKQLRELLPREARMLSVQR